MTNKNKNKLLLLLALNLLFISLFSVLSHSATVGTTTNTGAIYSTWNRYTTYANGIYWAFWWDGADAVYANSTNGTDWSAKNKIFSNSGPGANLRWSVRHIKGTNKIIAVWSDGASPGIARFRDGIMDSVGNISWNMSTDVTVASNLDSPVFPTTIKDSEGYPYITWRGAIGSYRPIRESKSNFTNGSSEWDTENNITLDNLGTSSRGGVMFDIGSQNMYIISANDTAAATISLVGNKFTNSTGSSGGWGSAVIIASNLSGTPDAAMSWSATQTNDKNIHLIYIDSDQNMSYALYNTASNSWGNFFVPHGGTITKLTLSTEGTNLYAFYVDSGQTNNYIYFRNYTNGIWGVQNTLKSDATAITGGISSYEASTNYQIGVIWSEGAASPYNVVFAAVNISSTCSCSSLQAGTTV